MSFKRCPGSTAFAQPKIEIVRCLHCGGEAEVWSDEAEGACPKCGQTVIRTNRQSCVDWCKYARECLGEEKYKKYQDTKSCLRKEALLRAVQNSFGWDEKRKQHAKTALRYAEAILKEQPAADPNIVVATIVLSVACERDTDSGAPPGTSGPSAEAGARGSQAVLEELNYPHGFVKQVCELIAAPPSGLAENVNFRVIHDAWLLAERRAGPERPDAGARENAGIQDFLTPAGQRIAQTDRHRNDV